MSDFCPSGNDRRPVQKSLKLSCQSSGMWSILHALSLPTNYKNVVCFENNMLPRTSKLGPAHNKTHTSRHMGKLGMTDEAERSDRLGSDCSRESSLGRHWLVLEAGRLWLGGGWEHLGNILNSYVLLGSFSHEQKQVLTSCTKILTAHRDCCKLFGKRTLKSLLKILNKFWF